MNMIQKYSLYKKIVKGASIWPENEEKRHGNKFITTLKYKIIHSSVVYEIESQESLEKGSTSYRTNVYRRGHLVTVFMRQRKAKKLFLCALYAMKTK